MNRKFSLLAVGNFNPINGFDIIVRAFAAFVEDLAEAEKTSIELTLVGEGLYKEKLYKLIELYQVSNWVKVIEKPAYKELRTYYRHASVFLHASFEEEHALLKRALSFELPIICFDSVASTRVVDDNCGVRISYVDFWEGVHDFHRAMAMLYDDPFALNLMKQGATKRYTLFKMPKPLGQSHEPKESEGEPSNGDQ